MLETSATEPRYDSIPPASWQTFFDAFTKILQARRTEIEIIGLAIGDQIEVEWASLNGLSYDRKEDTFWVYLDLGEALDHAIPHPREILARTGVGGLEDVIVVDVDGVLHIIRLRLPPLLPPHET
jgi:hypothetical protein